MDEVRPPHLASCEPANGRPRVLFVSVERQGLGHANRQCKLASSIADDCGCLIVGSNPYMTNFVPPGCDLLHLPGLGDVLRDAGEKPGLFPTLALERGGAARLRAGILRSAIEGFAPDLIVTDMVPYGLFDELRAAIASSDAIKYLVVRPVIGGNCSCFINSEIGRRALRDDYDRIIVAGMRTASMAEREIDVSDDIRAKISYIGYVSQPVAPEAIAAARQVRGIGDGTKWIVCSIGSGHYVPDFVETCLSAAERLPGVVFDIVAGPMTPAPDRVDRLSHHDGGRIRVMRDSSDLGIAHAAADLVVCHGGYNSMTEAMAGRTPLLVLSTHDPAQERRNHVRLLGAHYPVRQLEQLDALQLALREFLAEEWVPMLRAPGSVDLAGRKRFREIALADLAAVRQSPMPSLAEFA